MLLDRSIMFLLSYDPILCPQGFLCQAAFLSACEIFFELATEYCGENEEAKKNDQTCCVLSPKHQRLWLA